MLHVALSVDRTGLLNAWTLDSGAGAVWQGPSTVGDSFLVPGSPVAIFQQSTSVLTALIVDCNGVLNVAYLDLTGGTGWQGLNTVGGANLVPGSPVTVLKQSATMFMALMVDRNGVLNVATLDAMSNVWQGPDSLGCAILVPGSHVAVIQTGNTVFAALAVDRDGILNTATLDISTGTGWQGPDSVGNGCLPAGSRVYAL
jgi:hypothetical protein